MELRFGLGNCDLTLRIVGHVLHNYYAELEIQSMQALCLLGTGDTLNAAGRPADGKDAMQRAVALEHKALGVLLKVLLSIVDVCTTSG